VRHAGATKNVLAGVINISAVIIFVVRTRVDWLPVILIAVAAIIGGQLGVYLLRRINETVLRVAITTIGLLLTGALFFKA